MRKWRKNISISQTWLDPPKKMRSQKTLFVYNDSLTEDQIDLLWKQVEKKKMIEERKTKMQQAIMRRITTHALEEMERNKDDGKPFTHDF